MQKLDLNCILDTADSPGLTLFARG